MRGTFVFVVCGTADHIHTLHFSLKALRKFSKNEIVVITDSVRNEIKIEHENVVDIKTPEKFNHHQASIFLKTSAHKYLPKTGLYCYLDTDVVAIDNSVDEIFSHKTDVINFTSDHCKIQKFSPYAVNCNCLKQQEEQMQELSEILFSYDIKTYIKDPALKEKQKRLVKKFDEIKKNKLGYFLISTRFNLARKKFKLDDDTFFLKRERVWVDKKGDIILFDRPGDMVALIEKNTQWKLDKANDVWISPEGKPIDQLSCNHLAEAIFNKFNIKIEQANWQHWNGGMFLFDESSQAFLESWHSKTLAIFEDRYWKTRDQGTLIATAWEFGLQHVKPVPVEFNFLADYNHDTLQYLGNFTFSFGDKDKKIQPHFLHIYHHWGNKEWDVWKDVESHILSAEAVQPLNA